MKPRSRKRWPRVSGGAPPYAWEAVSALPEGFTLTPDGLLTAAPTRFLGEVTFTLAVTDATLVGSIVDGLLQCLRANKVTNMADARYRNALGGLDHLAEYKLM